MQQVVAITIIRTYLRIPFLGSAEVPGVSSPLISKLSPYVVAIKGKKQPEKKTDDRRPERELCCTVVGLSEEVGLQVLFEGFDGRRSRRIRSRRRRPPLTMAPLLPMPRPICLIENVDGNTLVLNKEAEKILLEISQPVVVIAIVGKYRTGKSYLMNKLAGSRTGFALGSSIQSKTKGIWMWCVPHPQKSGQTLVLLDTEGLGDVEKGDCKNDAWIFSLAVMLSSSLVFNSLGTIDQQSMEQLQSRENPSGNLTAGGGDRNRRKIPDRKILSDEQTGREQNGRRLKGFGCGAFLTLRNPDRHLSSWNTEGLGDVEKGDCKNDAWIFSLAVMLSSSLVFNSLGTIDQQSMEQLHYVTELTKLIKLKSSSKAEDTGEYKRYFPSFTWCVRDFTLILEKNGKEITEDEYLMSSLELKKVLEIAAGRRSVLYTGLQWTGRKYLKFYRQQKTHGEEVKKVGSSTLGTYDADIQPVLLGETLLKKLQKLEELNESELEEDFVEQATRFYSYMIHHSRVKSLAGGAEVTGR
ncbi:unnamed protein product, partial [Ranitomeya imitator]